MIIPELASIVPPHAFHVPAVSVDGARLIAWLTFVALAVRNAWRLLKRRGR